MEWKEIDMASAKTSELLKYTMQFYALIEDRKAFIRMQEALAKKRAIPFGQINEAKKEIKQFETYSFFIENELDKRIPNREVDKNGGSNTQ